MFRLHTAMLLSFGIEEIILFPFDLTLSLACVSWGLCLSLLYFVQWLLNTTTKRERNTQRRKIKSLHGNNAITVTCYRPRLPVASAPFVCFSLFCCVEEKKHPHSAGHVRLAPHNAPLTPHFGGGFFIMIRKEGLSHCVCGKWITSQTRGGEIARMPRGASWLAFFCVLFVVRLLVEHGVCELKGRSILLFSLSFWIRSPIARRTQTTTTTTAVDENSRKVWNFLSPTLIAIVIVWWMVKCSNILLPECGTCCKSLRKCSSVELEFK